MSKDSFAKITATQPRKEIYYVFLLTGLLILWLLLNFEALSSAVGSWLASETYKHCFFIIPACFYFIWNRRKLISKEDLQSGSIVAALLLTSMSLTGIWAQSQEYILISQFTAFSSLPLMIWTLIGSHAAKKLLFPLSFMLAAIPVGEEMIPLLQELTADIAMFLLKFTTLPVFRNGLFIEIPAGQFIVAETCSGVRFFISTIVFGAVYAYLSFNKTSEQLLFVCLAILTPLLANSIRVAGLILVGHYVGMEHASGDNHLLYGWIFFFAVLVLLFLFGEILHKSSNKKAERLNKDGPPLESHQAINFDTFAKKSQKATYMTIGILILSVAIKHYIDYS